MAAVQTPSVARKPWRPSPGLARLLVNIGGLGLILVIVAIVWALYDNWDNRRGMACEVLDRDRAKIDTLGIINVSPPQFGLGGRICVVVNLIDRQRFGELTGARDAARGAFDRAEAALRAERLRPGSTPATIAPLIAGRDDRKKWLDDAESARAAFLKPPKLTFFIDDQALPQARETPSQDVAGTLRPIAVPFEFETDADASSDSSTVWRKLMAAPGHEGFKEVKVGIAVEGQTLATYGTTKTADMEKLSIRLYYPGPRYLGLVGMGLMLLGLVGLAYQGGLLREGLTNETPFSLSRVQMAMWLVLSLAGFVYIWLVTGQFFNVLPKSTFVLIGIAGTTAGAARVVEDVGTAQAQAAGNETAGFWADLASAPRGRGVELHRLQMIAWTMVLGLIYGWNIVAKLSLTDFDSNLLVLAGVVSGVYVGLKTQEAPSPQAANGSATAGTATTAPAQTATTPPTRTAATSPAQGTTTPPVSPGGTTP